ncbi:ephrin type-B receptor 2-like isoform X2 [Anneissia japonica]|nr:ephrin type-B receptor 2-like isoform X2 [Anneissia japonica]
MIYPKTNSSQQWVETGASYERRYQVCAILSRTGSQNFWLRTPYLHRSGANRIHVEIEFTMSSCEGRNDGLVLSCRETFDLYYIEANADYATETTPSWNSPPYTKIRRIAADGRFSMQNDVRNTVDEVFGPVSQNGFYLAFQDQGACMAILRVRVYYIKCPSVIAGLARFPETITGSEVTSLVSVTGTCLENTERIGSHDPTYQCQSDGMWILLRGSCGCKAGFELQENTCSGKFFLFLIF